MSVRGAFAEARWDKQGKRPGCLARGGGSGTQITLGGGPILYRPELVKGGSSANPAACMRRMADAGSPFVKN